MKRRTLIALAIALITSVNVPAQASVVTLTNVDDTFIDGSTILGTNNNNHGAESTFKASRNGSFWAEALIRFNDVFGTGQSQVPINAMIRNASLHIWLDVSWGRDPNPYSLYQLTNDWNEATVTSNLFGRVLNQSNGVPIDTVAGPIVNPFETNTEFVFDVTSSLVAWQHGTTNHGWGLTADAARNDFSPAKAAAPVYGPICVSISSPYLNPALRSQSDSRESVFCRSESGEAADRCGSRYRLLGSIDQQRTARCQE